MRNTVQALVLSLRLKSVMGNTQRNSVDPVLFQDEDGASVSSSDAGLGSEHESEAATIGKTQDHVFLLNLFVFPSPQSTFLFF